MEHIKVKKETVLDVLKKNLAQHQKDYDEAVIGWIEKAKVELKKILEKLDLPNAINTKVDITNLPKPFSYVKEYEKAIKMIEFETREEIEISEADFEHYFLDEWNWKSSFLTNTTMYKNFKS
jgi:hypothetical protein